MGGFFNSITEGDGVVRSIPLLAEYKGAYYESLSLAMFRMLVGLPDIEPGFPQERFLSRSYQGLESILLKQGSKTLAIPVDDRVATLVPFRGPGGANGGSYRYISASDVLAKRVSPGQLKDKIILLGTTAPGLLDTCWTALRSGGRLVANAVTVESELQLLQWHQQVGGELSRIAIQRTQSIGGFLGWKPLIPVTQLIAVK